MIQKVNVIGAGLAGVEACYQLVKRNIPVRLYEMRPKVSSPAHHTDQFAELVCSNSLRSDSLENAVGVLKKEMEGFDSLIISMARKHAVPSGGSLAVDRDNFSQAITTFIQNHPLVEVVYEEVTSAAAPIVTKDSINFDIAYYKSRYDKGEAEYINCPMTEAEFNAFYEALIHAEVVKPKEFEEKFFEGCMPFEEIARRGKQTLLFGPMKPVGLERPDGTRAHAVVQLRQDNASASLYNIVGFQTHLTWPEQKRIISMIPGLENARFVRYGVMHRNSYLCSPLYLKPTFQFKERDDLFFAGQMTGVEGYVESAASGMMAGINMTRLLQGKQPHIFSRDLVMGSLAYYITHASKENFQPMKANFGILPALSFPHKKKQRKSAYAYRSLEKLEEELAIING